LVRFRAGRVSFSHEGHFGGRAGFEFEIGRLETFIGNFDGRRLRFVLQRGLGGDLRRIAKCGLQRDGPSQAA
jgi:hypothetical protein